MRLFMFVDPCLIAENAARWNLMPHQNWTGVESTHNKYQFEITGSVSMLPTITGAVRMTLTVNCFFKSRYSPSLRSRSLSTNRSVSISTEYPASVTALLKASKPTRVGIYWIDTLSVARLTITSSTPSSSLRDLSTAFTHAAQVIP